MRAIQIFLNGDFMGNTTVSGLPALQNLCQALDLDQNWAEEEKAFYITAADPVTPVTHLAVDSDEVRIMLYPDPTIVLPSSPEPPTESEAPLESPSNVPLNSPVNSPVDHRQPLGTTALMARVAGTTSTSPDPRTPPGSGAVFVFRRASLPPDETLNYETDQPISDSLEPTFGSPPEPESEPTTQPVRRPPNPPLRSDLRRTPPPRIHAQGTRVIQAGSTVIRI